MLSCTQGNSIFNGRITKAKGFEAAGVSLTSARRVHGASKGTKGGLIDYDHVLEEKLNWFYVDYYDHPHGNRGN